MGGFLIFAGVVTGLVLLVRLLRRREMEAFLKADVSVLGELPLVAQAPPVERIERPVEFSLREHMMDEVLGHFLRVVRHVAGDGYHVFVDVPVAEFVRASASMPDDEITFLLCRLSDYKPVCGVFVRGASPSEAGRTDRLRNLFGQVGLPLVVLPMVQQISYDEVKEALAPYV